MAIIYEKNFTDPNEKVVRQFTNCCGASDKGTEWGIVCRGCYAPIEGYICLLYTSPSPRDLSTSRMPSSA